jgi:hypothetical protein
MSLHLRWEGAVVAAVRGIMDMVVPALGGVEMHDDTDESPA